MSRIEELVYSALEHGKRNDLFDEVSKIKQENPNMLLQDIYDKAYQRVMKT
jgi:hypothetical protein|tara:strand:- start:708 stop:860 length:153 start_codon:yes stop_codon:yes gene_type:complete